MWCGIERPTVVTMQTSFGEVVFRQDNCLLSVVICWSNNRVLFPNEPNPSINTALDSMNRIDLVSTSAKLHLLGIILVD